MGNLFTVEVQTNRGKRYRVPLGNNVVMSEKDARGLFLVCLDTAKKNAVGTKLGGVSVRVLDSIYLVNVDAHGKRMSDAETRRKHWQWKGGPLGVAA